MGFYVDRVLPRVQARFCGASTLAGHRETACAGLLGHVVEIGFGSGHNVPYYPPAVTRVSAVEPSDLAWRLSADRRAASPVVVERVGLDGQSLPFDAGVLDAALSTFTLCSIPDVPVAAAELRRVLRPGARLHFVEHGRSPEPGVQRWQRRLNPLQRRLGGGCRLDVPVADVLADAGFTLERLENCYAANELRPLGYLYVGVARA